ncbi:hypothetical protein A6J63_008875 [Yersinia enterocolitica]|nr:hypothetical protein A6J63_008875 [Yersinia enterocolitica]
MFMASAVLAKRIGRRIFETYSEFIYKDDIAAHDKERDIKITSRCIAAFAIDAFGETNDHKQAGFSVCDGFDDNGIDALYVNHALKTMVIVQSKYDQQASGSIAITDFLRFKDSCTELMDEKFNLFNKLLKRFQSDIHEAITNFDYKILCVYAYTGKKELSDDVNRRITDWEKEINASMGAENIDDRDTYIVRVIPFSLEDMVSFLRKESSHSVVLENVELLQYGMTTEPYEAVFGIISGIQLADWWETYADKLLEKNIRGVLGGKTDVNLSIKDTLNTSPEKFWYFNNGITVLVEDIKKKERKRASIVRDSGNFNFKNASIINGAQTLSTIGMNADSIDEGFLETVKVPIRFIKIAGDDNFAELVTRANNHQNRVTGRDFASQDPEQIRIQNEIFVERNFKYNIHRQDFVDNLTDSVIDLDEALSAIVCFLGDERLLATLKSSRGRFYDNLSGGIYRNVFNPTVSGIFTINVVTLYREIAKEITRETRNSTGKLNAILTHGNYAIAALVMNNYNIKKDTRDIIDFDLTKIPPLVKNISNSTTEYIMVHHPECYIARFFQNKEKIKEILTQTEFSTTI